MVKHLELPPQDSLNKPRDHEPIRMVPPSTWHCLFCQPNGGDGAGTTVEWLGPGTDGADGRCRECGAKFCLGTFADASVYPALDEVK